MEFCLTLDIIGDYFKKSLQVFQFYRYRNIIIDIYEYDIPSYNESERAIFEEQKIKLKKETKLGSEGCQTCREIRQPMGLLDKGS